MDRTRIRDPQDELVEVRAGVEPAGPNATQGSLELGSTGGAEGGHIAQAVWAEAGQVDARGQGQEGLIRADVAGRPLAPDVLLPSARS